MQPNISVDTNCDEIQVYTFNRKNLQYRRNYFRPSLNSFFCRGNSQKEVKYISKLFKMIALLCLVCAHLCLNSKNGHTEMKMKLLPETRKLYQNKAGDPFWTWLDNRNIKNTNRRDLRNLIGAFIQLLPFFCQRIKRFRLQFSTASVIKLPHSPCKTLLQCDAWMNSQFLFPENCEGSKNGASFLLTGSEPLLLGMTMLMASLPFLPLVGPLLPPTITNHNHPINSASSQGLFVNNANGNVSHL